MTFKIRFAYDDIGWSPDGSRQLEALADIAAVGFRGFETVGRRLRPCLDAPDGLERLRALLKSHGLQLACASGTSDEIARLVKVLGGRVVMTGPPGQRVNAVTTPEEFADMARTLDEQGRRIADHGLRMGVHPVVFCRAAQPDEIRRLLDLTDPQFVHFIPDSGQITMGGGDPVQLCREYADRIVHLHLSDTAPEYRGGRGGYVFYSYQEAVAGHYMRDLGTGGVDFLGLIDVLRKAGFDGWASVETYLPLESARKSCEANRRYIEEVLGLPLMPPAD